MFSVVWGSFITLMYVQSDKMFRCSYHHFGIRQLFEALKKDLIRHD